MEIKRFKTLSNLINYVLTYTGCAKNSNTNFKCRRLKRKRRKLSYCVVIFFPFPLQLRNERKHQCLTQNILKNAAHKDSLRKLSQRCYCYESPQLIITNVRNNRLVKSNDQKINRSGCFRTNVLLSCLNCQFGCFPIFATYLIKLLRARLSCRYDHRFLLVV
uniref:Uncharacterized protein n=1 Tax=Heterorhabditis bacteriophora TaxID=37862 RepID=A0A1I7WAW7_HETBA